MAVYTNLLSVPCMAYTNGNISTKSEPWRLKVGLIVVFAGG